MPEPKILPNGNIEITVQLLPEAYAALASVKDRDKGSTANIVNVALVGYDLISAAAAKAGRPLSISDQASQ